jgi:hypothetical protein
MLTDRQREKYVSGIKKRTIGRCLHTERQKERYKEKDDKQRQKE